MIRPRARAGVERRIVSDIGGGSREAARPGAAGYNSGCTRPAADGTVTQPAELKEDYPTGPLAQW